jgi:nanoRNase/pAp phosphatase (c-di-AMP/oligoRNAs hydrolase)
MQIVTTHKGTDFDGLASLVAATLIYPDSISVLPKSINPNVKAFLSIHKDLFKIYSVADVDLKRVDRLVVVDTNSWRRLEGMESLKEKDDVEILLWDHHADNGDIDPTWKSQEDMGANITLLIRQLKEERKLLTPIQATLFLAGLYEDTGNLMFPATQAEDAYAAAYLMDFKADLNVLGTLLRPGYGQRQKNILFEMLQNAKRIKKDGYTISINDLEIEGHVGNLSVVVNMYREIMNVDAAFGIFVNKANGRCIVIGRSNIDEIDIGTLMKSIGGGGHPGAGSALLKSVQPEAIKEMIIELVQGNQRSSVQVSDLMSFPVLSVPPDMRMKDVALILREKGCTGIPVIDNDRLVGMISRRDFRKVRNDSQKGAPVKAFMSTTIRTISPGKSPMQAARLMVKHDVGRLPVVANERVIGIITRSDAMLYFYDLLPD